MKFSDEEIALAQLFKAYGLRWEPAPGQYVLDQGDLIGCPSPFQERVYFILDLKHFLRRAETLDNLKDRMCWLPNWEDAREILAGFGVSAETIVQRLLESDAISKRSERLELYRLLEEVMTGVLVE